MNVMIFYLKPIYAVGTIRKLFLIGYWACGSTDNYMSSFGNFEEISDFENTGI